MMDYINYRRYKIVKQRTITIKRTQQFGSVGRVYVSESLSGQVDTDSTELRSGQIKKFVNMCIPGTNFGPNGKITYIGEGDDKAKFYEYSVHVLSYVNPIKTDNPTIPVTYAGGRVNCYVRLFFFLLI